jgi:hypothetical protein
MRTGSLLPALLLSLLVAACPATDDDDDVDVEAAALFDPNPLDLGEFRAIEGLPTGGAVTLRNIGEARLSVEDVSTAAELFDVRPTVEADYPIVLDPGGWLTFEVTWIGTPDPGRTDYGATITAELTPPRGDAAFPQSLYVDGAIRLRISCDADGDGHAAELCGGEDCDDLDPEHSPDTPELCNGLDENCNGIADADVGLEVDADGDDVLSCDDCDDDDPAIFPGSIERCDGVDNDCDPDTEAEGGEADYDTDGFLACEECDDMDHDNAPGNVEVCDGQDNDCDGLPSDLELDDDGDTYTECEGDCDDGAGDVHPFAEDTPGDGVDSDCDGSD